jgi:hypothetical protein
VVGSSEDYNEHSGSIRGEEFLAISATISFSNRTCFMELAYGKAGELG